MVSMVKNRLSIEQLFNQKKYNELIDIIENQISEKKKKLSVVKYIRSL